MAATPEIDIEIQLSGAQKVEKSIEGIETGLQGIGETGSKLVKAMGSTNEKLGDGLENVAGSVGEVREAFTQLGGSIKTLGTSGMSGILGLIGPLGLLVGAGVTVYETFRQISGSAQEAEDAQEAMAAAASDLQSRLESLAESGIILAKQEMVNFSVAVLEAQFLKERVQKQQEKFAKNFEGIRKQIEAVQKAQEDLDFVQRFYGQNVEMITEKTQALKQAENQLNFERRLAQNHVEKLNKANTFYLRSIEKLTAIEEKAREQSTENLKKEAIRLANLIKNNDELRFQNELKKDQIQLNEMLTQINVDHIELTKALEDANRKQIEEILRGLKARTKGINEITIAERKAEQEREKIQVEAQKKRRDSYRKHLKDRTKIAEQQRKKEIVLNSRLRQLDLQEEQRGLDLQVSLLEERLRTSIELTKQGSKEREIAEKQFRVSIAQLSEKELERLKKTEDEKQAVLKESAIKRLELNKELAQMTIEAEQTKAVTDFGQLKEDQEKRRAILELAFTKEIEVAKLQGEDTNAIHKKFALERLRNEQNILKEQTELLTDYFDQYGKGFAEAAVGALLFGDSFQEATAGILKGLAQQAGVESLMSLAKGFAQVALGDPKSAASFKAAALFGTAAVVAGAAGNALSTGGGPGGGSSPTGTPTTAPSPQREEIQNDSMVFNINFGGAVVYDTKKAAEQALADRLVTIMNTSRRGSPRMNRR